MIATLLDPEYYDYKFALFIEVPCKPHKTSVSAYSNPFKRVFIVNYSHRFRLASKFIVIKLLSHLTQ